MKRVAYVVEVREIELGWGDRPDGFILGVEKVDIDKFVASSRAFRKENREYSELVGSVKMCEITEDTEQALIKSKENVLWLINKKEFNESILSL